MRNNQFHAKQCLSQEICLKFKTFTTCFLKLLGFSDPYFHRVFSIHSGEWNFMFTIMLPHCIEIHVLSRAYSTQCVGVFSTKLVGLTSSRLGSVGSELYGYPDAASSYWDPCFHFALIAYGTQCAGVFSKVLVGQASSRLGSGGSAAAA